MFSFILVLVNTCTSDHLFYIYIYILLYIFIFLFFIFVVIDKQTDVRSLDSTTTEGNDVILRCSFAEDLYEVSLWITDDGVIVLPLTRTNTALGMYSHIYLKLRFWLGDTHLEGAGNRWTKLWVNNKTAYLLKQWKHWTEWRVKLIKQKKRWNEIIKHKS